jgi:hypothetical protein
LNIKNFFFFIKFGFNLFSFLKKSVSIGDLPKICDALSLHLLTMSEDLSFHFKFMDVVRDIAQ